MVPAFPNLDFFFPILDILSDSNSRYRPFPILDILYSLLWILFTVNRHGPGASKKKSGLE